MQLFFMGVLHNSSKQNVKRFARALQVSEEHHNMVFSALRVHCVPLLMLCAERDHHTVSLKSIVLPNLMVLAKKWKHETGTGTVYFAFRYL